MADIYTSNLNVVEEIPQPNIVFYATMAAMLALGTIGMIRSIKK